MEEDIKILEESIIESDFYVYDFRVKQAIENIIKGYRELEEENKKAYAKYLNARTCIDKLSKQTIPKSKIKEKIEELETKLKVFEKDIRYCKDRVQARLMNDEIYVLRRCMDLLKEIMEDK